MRSVTEAYYESTQSNNTAVTHSGTNKTFYLSVNDGVIPNTSLVSFFNEGDIIYLADNHGSFSGYMTVQAINKTCIKVSIPVNTPSTGLFVHKVNSQANTMTVTLSQRNVTHVELIGYSLNVKSVGVMDFHHDAHDSRRLHARCIDDDYYILRCPELEKHDAVISNNHHANGAFAVLPAHDIGNSTDAPDSKHHVLNWTMGFKKVRFEGHLNKIQLQLLDRRGLPAKVARAHFWFRVFT